MVRIEAHTSCMGRVGPADLTSQFWAEDGRSPRKSAQINVSFVLRGNKSDSLLGREYAAMYGNCTHALTASLVFFSTKPRRSTLVKARLESSACDHDFAGILNGSSAFDVRIPFARAFPAKVGIPSLGSFGMRPFRAAQPRGVDRAVAAVLTVAGASPVPARAIRAL